METNSYELREQTLDLFINHDSSTIKCITELTIKNTNPSLCQLELNARQIKIHRITINSKECTFEYNDPSSLPFLTTLQNEICQYKTEFPSVSPLNFPKVLSAEFKKIESDSVRPELIIKIPEFEGTCNTSSHPSDLTSADVYVAEMSLRIEYSLDSSSVGVSFSKDPIQFFTFNYHSMARYWMPCFDNTVIRCKWKISVYTFQYQCTSISIGKLVENSSDSKKKIYLSRFIQEVPTSAKDVIVYSAISELYKITNAEINVFYPQKMQSKVTLLENTIVQTYEFVKWFINCSFPFDTLNIIFAKNAIHPSITCSNVVIISSNYLYDSNILEQPFITKSTISFAICKIFFGSFIFPKTPNDRWLILGIAYYINRQFCKFIFGANDFKYQLKLDIESVSRSDKGKLPLYNNEVIDDRDYDFFCKKSSLVFHLIEQKIEQTPLQKILNNIVDEFGNGEMSYGLSTHHFFKLVRKITGKDLKAMSDQWIFNSGCPSYNCTFTYNRSKSTLELSLKQQSDNLKSNFYGQLVIRVFENEGVYDHVLQIDENSQYFELPIFTKTKKKIKKKRIGDESTQEMLQSATLVDDEQVDIDTQEGIVGDDASEDIAVMSSPIEWVIVDPELNWISLFHVNNSDFLWTECLDEEKDVISQHQAIRTLETFPSEISVIAYEKTLSNWRNFYKIRIEAAIGLSTCSVSSLNFIGLARLSDFFMRRFCFPSSSKIPSGIYPVKPNDFELINNGFLQKMICMAISISNPEGNVQAQNQILCLLLSCLLLNDNAENAFSDLDYISGIFFALTLAINKPADPSVKIHLKSIVDEVQRYLFLDKIYRSFHNATTVSCLMLLKKLQCLSYIPFDFDFYISLLSPVNFIDVRLAAVEVISLFASQNEHVFEFLLDLIHIDQSYVFKDIASAYLLNAIEVNYKNVGYLENSPKLKEKILNMLFSNLSLSVKKNLIEVSSIAFLPYSIPELEDDEEEEEEEEEIPMTENEAIIDVTASTVTIPAKYKTGKKKKLGVFAIPEETEEHLAMRVSAYVLDKLFNFADAYVFKYPVDPETPFYYDIIENPIDLSRISAKKYTNIHDFFADLALLLRNCFTFNDHNSSVALCAKKVRNLLFREIRKIIPVSEQGTVITMLKNVTEIPPDTPLIRYSLLQLKNLETAKPFLSDLDEVKTRLDEIQIHSFEDFRQEIVNVITNSMCSEEIVTAFSNSFNDFLTAIGKKKATVPCKSRKRVESIIDSIVSKLKLIPNDDSAPSTTSISAEVQKYMADIISKLFDSDYSIWFRLPVDPILHNAPDYFDVVKTPIDLSTIQRKLNEGKYEIIQDFEDDLILLFENCFLYNPEGSRVCEDAKNLEKLFVKEWSRCKEKLKKHILGAGGSRILIDLESEGILPLSEKSYQTKLSPDQFSAAVKFIFYQLTTQSFSQPFIYPVSFNIISYYNIIKNPISLSKMQEKYFNHLYKNIKELEKDFELLLKNCYFFNQSSSFIYQMGKKMENFYVLEVIPWLESGKYMQKYCEKIPEKVTKKIDDILERLSSFEFFSRLICSPLKFPFEWNLLSQKNKNGYFSSFNDFEKEVRFFFSFLLELVPSDDENNQMLSCLECSKKYFESIIQEASDAEVAVEHHIKPLKIKLHPTVDLREATAVDVPKIPPTPKKQLVIQIKNIKPPKPPSYIPPISDSSLVHLTISSPKSDFFIEMFFEKLFKFKFSVDFLQPVDPVSLGIPDYLEVIKEPMDLSTAYTNWKSGKYKNLSELVRDLSLIIYNCNFYNPPESIVVDAAFKLNEFIKKEVTELSKNLQSIQDKEWKDSLEDYDKAKALLKKLLQYCGNFNSFQEYVRKSNETSKKSISTVLSNLECKCFYSNVEEIIEDVYAFFFKCIAFSPIDSEAYQSALKCQIYFEELFDEFIKRPFNIKSPVSDSIIKSFLSIIIRHELSLAFQHPVDPISLGIPKYPDLIRNPMDFSTMLSTLYESEEQFLHDLMLIFKNCCRFNIEGSDLWKISKVFGNWCLHAWTTYKFHHEKIKEIADLDKFILLGIIEKSQSLPEAEPFLAPVDGLLYPTYYKVIKTPMDLQTLSAQTARNQFDSVKDFLQAVKLISKNCIKFNGKESEISRAAQQLESFIEKEVLELFYIRKK